MPPEAKRQEKSVAPSKGRLNQIFPLSMLLLTYERISTSNREFLDQTNRGSATKESVQVAAELSEQAGGDHDSCTARGNARRSSWQGSADAQLLGPCEASAFLLNTNDHAYGMIPDDHIVSALMAKHLTGKSCLIIIHMKESH